MCDFDHGMGIKDVQLGIALFLREICTIVRSVGILVSKHKCFSPMCIIYTTGKQILIQLPKFYIDSCVRSYSPFSGLTLVLFSQNSDLSYQNTDS